MQGGTRLLLLSAALLALHCRAGTDTPGQPKPPYSVEQLRAWHRSMEPWPWLGAPERQVQLKNGQSHELLLAVAGYARGGTYVLFDKSGDAWLQISDEIEQAHHPLHVLNAANDGWRDFESFVPAWGSGGAEVWVYAYRWNGKKYVLRNRQEGKWCDFEPFKGDMELCPAR